MKAVYQGIADEMLRLVEEKQLKDRSLWKLAAKQFAGPAGGADRASAEDTGGSGLPDGACCGWPDDADHGWRGEYWGKLMRGACMTWQYTGDQELYDILTETVRELLSFQEADGRISTYSRKEEFTGWDLWCRKYVLLGLIHFYEICTDEAFRQQVLEAAGRHLDYVISRIGEGEGKKKITLASDHWLGINSSSILEPVVRLYLRKPEKRYLEFADYIVGTGGAEGFHIFEAAYEDRLCPYQYPVTKAYELMSCFEGLLFYAQVKNSEKWRQAVIRFADRLLETEATVAGGSGCEHELFNHSSLMQSGTKYDGLMLETCVTVTWMKLMERVYRLTGELKYLEEAERSAFNALYGAVNTKGAVCGPEAAFDEPYYREVYDRAVRSSGPQMFDSYSPLRAGIRGRAVGGFKSMEENTAYCGCCIAIAAAGCALVPLMAARDRAEGIEIGILLPGRIRTEVQGVPVELSVKTAYPLPGETAILVQTQEEREWELRIRIPSFAEAGTVRVEAGRRESGEEAVLPGSFLVLKRRWRNGDAVRLSLSWGLRCVRGMENPEDEESARQTAVLYGPLTLARDRRLEEKRLEEKRAEAGDAEKTVFVRTSAEAEIPCQCCLDMTLGEKTFPMIDYASAGKTWRRDSQMEVWIRD